VPISRLTLDEAIARVEHRLAVRASAPEFV